MKTGMRFSTLVLFTAISACTGILAWGCGGGDPDRRVVTVYSPHGKPILPEFEKLFEAAHPDVDVRWLDMGSQDVLDRVPHTRDDLGEERVFLWRPDTDRAAFKAWRTVDEDAEDARDVEDVPPEEIAAAARHVLEGHIAMPRKDLCRETARVLGWPRLGSTVERCMDEGIARLLERGDAREDGDNIVM